MSLAEETLAVQLEQAGIPFERQAQFDPSRKWKADFLLAPAVWLYGKTYMAGLLVEVDGGTWVLGRHNHPTSIGAEYEKGAAAAILGFRVIHCTSEQAEDGTCLGWIRAALGLEEKAA